MGSYQCGMIGFCYGDDCGNVFQMVCCIYCRYGNSFFNVVELYVEMVFRYIDVGDFFCVQVDVCYCGNGFRRILIGCGFGRQYNCICVIQDGVCYVYYFCMGWYWVGDY